MASLLRFLLYSAVCAPNCFSLAFLCPFFSIGAGVRFMVKDISERGKRSLAKPGKYIFTGTLMSDFCLLTEKKEVSSRIVILTSGQLIVVCFNKDFDLLM